MYLESLDAKDRQEVKGPMPSTRIFRFENKKLRLGEKYLLPSTIGEKDVTLKVDCVNSNIPLIIQ